MTINEILEKQPVKDLGIKSKEELGAWLYTEIKVKNRIIDSVRKDLELEIGDMKPLLKKLDIKVPSYAFSAKDYTGQTINGVLFICMTDERSNSQIKWLCRCSCGNDKWIVRPGNVFKGNKCKKCQKLGNTGATKKYGDEWVRLYDNGNGLSTQQIGEKFGCSSSTVESHLKKMGVFVNKNTPGNHHGNKGFGDISGSYYGKVKAAARKRGIDFQITIQQMDAIFKRQNGRCALSGKKLIVPKHNMKGNASFDRIDSTLPYIYENCQFIDKRINEAKMALNQDEYIKECAKVYLYNKKKKNKSKPSKQLELAF